MGDRTPDRKNEQRWRVTLFYEDGPRAGEYQEPILRQNPDSLDCGAASLLDPQGRKWAYRIAGREIDPAKRTILVWLRWQVVSEAVG